MTIHLPGYAVFNQISHTDKYNTYQAIREKDQRPVLIKIIQSDHPTLDEIASLKNEYEMARHLAEDSIIKPLLLDKYLQQFFLVLEDNSFEPLSRLLKSTTLSLKEKLKIALSTSKSLWSIQKKQVIHRDLKPQNVFINPKTFEARISGLGQSTRMARQKVAIKNPSAFEGDLAYISPEQTGRMNRDIDYRTDYYSLGVIFYELFTGVRPFITLEPIEMIHAHLAVVPNAPYLMSQGIPKPLSDIIMKLLAKPAQERYSNTLSLIHDLEHCLEDLSKSGTIHPFEIAQNDISPTFQIAQKLYGREREVEKLLFLVDAMSQSAPRLCLISGYSGIGKSSLSLEMQKPLIERGGVFISGKFDQFKTNIPYFAFIQALQDLIHHILTLSDDKISFWKMKIMQSLGKNASVITDVIPELKLIIGETEKVQTLDTEQTHNRFSILFQQFITTFASSETPLLIFLDDLQWVDSASQKLIEILMMSLQTRGLLIVGAYRSNEIDRYHPLQILINHINESLPSRITEIEVSPLSKVHVAELLSDTLRQDLDNVAKLGDTIFDKTEGNPFFINQLLNYLYNEKLLEFEPEKGKWLWDINKVNEAKISDNIVTLLINKLQKCSRITQDILMLAACTGHSFDVNILSHISDYPISVIVKHIKEAIEEGFIVTDGHVAEFYWESTSEIGETLSTKGSLETLKFPHDRVQQAIYSMIPEEKRKEEHLKIGRILTQTIPQSNLEEKIFEVVYQINHAEDLVYDHAERVKYAQFNLLAGKRAMNSVAYRTALEHLKMGIKFLPSDKWEKHYHITFPLELNFAECSFLTGDFDEAEKMFNHAMQMAQTDDEKFSIYILKIKLFISTTKYDEAIKNGQMALSLLGATFPKNVTKIDILKELILVKLKMFRHNTVSILSLPEIQDKNKQRIIHVLSILLAPAYLSARELYALIVLKGVHYSIKWGHSPHSSYFFCSYGIILNIIFRDLKGLETYGKLGSELCQRFADQAVVPATKFLLGTFIVPFHHPLTESIQILNSSFETGIAVGDFIYGVYSLAQMMSYQLTSSKNLQEMKRELLNYREFVSKVKAHNRGFMFLGAQQMIKALEGKTEAPWLMDSENFNENEFFKKLTEGNFPLSLFFIYTYKMQLTFLFEHYTECQDVGKKAEAINFAVRGHPINLERDFFYALSVTQNLDKITGAHRRELSQILKRFKIYASSCPQNFFCKYQLIQAEIARIEGKKEQAIESYDLAIESAKENDFIQIAAIGNELFAKYWISQNKWHLAKQNMIEAHYGYYYWGAVAKVKDLEEKYPRLLTASKNEHNPFLSLKDEIALPETMDITSMMKASEVLSGELNFEKLLRDLMKILTENAGAERALLVLDKDNKWVVEAEEIGGRFLLHPSIPLENSEELFSSSVIYFVLRTKENLVLDNAIKTGLFTTDPYILSKKVHSVLALPLMHQGQLIGALWLENNLSTNAFTPERVEILKLLSSQIANSIVNARLYTQQTNLSRELQMSNTKLEDYSQNLEKKVYLRTHELKEKNSQLQDTLKQVKEMQKLLVQQEKLVSLGAITKAIASEMRTPLNYIFNFAKVAQEMVQDMKEEKKIPADKTFTLLSDDLQKINDHAKKADEIITQMLEESRTTDLKPEPTDVNKLIRDYADLVYYNYYKKDPLFVLSIETDWDTSLPKLAIVSHNIGRVIYNVIDNACYSTNQKKKESPADFTPSLSLSTKNLDKFVEIKIRDNGKGIPKEMLDKIFTPYTTSKPGGKSAGMGLSLSQDIIVNEHGGKISINSEVNEWTEVTLLLPKTV